jgi:hypothetical protein
MTSQCGDCGFENPNEATKCAECGAEFYVDFDLPEVPSSSTQSALSSSSSSSQGNWKKLKLPAKCGPVEVAQNGECITSDGFRFKATSEFEKAPIRGGWITIQAGKVTMQLERGRLMRLKFEEHSWHLLEETYDQPLNPAPPRKVRFPGLTNATILNTIPPTLYQQPLLAPHNGRSLLDLGHEIVVALRQAQLPILITWAGSHSQNVHQQLGFYTKSAFMGQCWVYTQIICRWLGENHSVEISTGLSYWRARPEEIQRVRRGYVPLAIGGVVALAAYCLVAFGLGPLNLMASTLKTSTLSLVFWRSIVALVLYLVALYNIAQYRAKLHFPEMQQWRDNIKRLVHLQFRIGDYCNLPFLFIGYFILSIYLVDPPVGSQQPIPFSGFLSAAPEVVLFGPRVILFVCYSLFGCFHGRPQLMPNDTRFGGLHNAICKVVADVLGHR